MNIVQALHTEVKGSYETAHGMTPQFPMHRGTGQGCALGGTRALYMAAVMQKAVAKLVPGVPVTAGQRPYSLVHRHQ